MKKLYTRGKPSLPKMRYGISTFIERPKLCRNDRKLIPLGATVCFSYFDGNQEFTVNVWYYISGNSICFYTTFFLLIKTYMFKKYVFFIWPFQMYLGLIIVFLCHFSAFRNNVTKEWGRKSSLETSFECLSAVINQLLSDFRAVADSKCFSGWYLDFFGTLFDYFSIKVLFEPKFRKTPYKTYYCTTVDYLQWSALLPGAGNYRQYMKPIF